MMGYVALDQKMGQESRNLMTPWELVEKLVGIIVSCPKILQRCHEVFLDQPLELIEKEHHTDIQIWGPFAIPSIDGCLNLLCEKLDAPMSL